MDDLKPRKIIEEFLKELNLFFNRNEIIIPFKELTFRIPFNGNLINAYLKDCDTCSVDCYKKLPTNFQENFVEYIDFIIKTWKKAVYLKEKDVILLSKVILLQKEPEKVLDLNNIKEILTSKIKNIRFILIGLDGVGKSTIFEFFPGKMSKYESLVESFIKINETFESLTIELLDLGNTIIENILSESIAPLIKSELSNAYMFILITDSTSKNVMKSKISLLPKLNQLNPYALIICIANKQDIPNTLNYETIENILGIRTYPLTATDPKSYEEFMKIIWETVLLRIEQMKEHNCPYL